jgi:hypothetical protein
MTPGPSFVPNGTVEDGWSRLRYGLSVLDDHVRHFLWVFRATCTTAKVASASSGWYLRMNVALGPPGSDILQINTDVCGREIGLRIVQPTRNDGVTSASSRLDTISL